MPDLDNIVIHLAIGVMLVVGVNLFFRSEDKVARGTDTKHLAVILANKAFGLVAILSCLALLAYLVK